MTYNFLPFLSCIISIIDKVSRLMGLFELDMHKEIKMEIIHKQLFQVRANISSVTRRVCLCRCASKVVVSCAWKCFHQPGFFVIVTVDYLHVPAIRCRCIFNENKSTTCVTTSINPHLCNYWVQVEDCDTIQLKLFLNLSLLGLIRDNSTFDFKAYNCYVD